MALGEVLLSSDRYNKEREDRFWDTHVVQTATAYGKKGNNVFDIVYSLYWVFNSFWCMAWH